MLCIPDLILDLLFMKLKKFFINIYVRNILLAIVVTVALILLTLWWLKVYTHHGESVEIPNLKGLTIEKAQSAFQDGNLNFQVIDSVFNRNATPGTIVETIPPIGTKVKKGRTIYITLNSFSSLMLTIPEITDRSQRQAVAILKSVGFEDVNVKQVPGAYQGLVVGLETKNKPLTTGESVPITTPLTLLVSSGVGDISLSSDSIEIEDTTEESWF